MLYIPICWNHTEEFRKIFKNTLSYYLSNNELDYFEFFENTYPSFMKRSYSPIFQAKS